MQSYKMLNHIQRQICRHHRLPFARKISGSTKPSSNSMPTLLGATVGFGVFIPLYISYELEIGNPTFQRFDHPALNSTRNALRATGLLPPKVIPSAAKEESSDIVEVVQEVEKEVQKIETSASEELTNEQIIENTASVEQAIIDEVQPTIEVASEVETIPQQIIVPETVEEPVANETPIAPPVVPSPFSKAINSPNTAEVNYNEDLSSLDENALRQRLSHLTAELTDRTRWEGVRSQQMLMHAEAAMEKRFTEILDKERLESELDKQLSLKETEKALRDQASKDLAALEASLQERLQGTLRAQAEGFSKSLNDELKGQEDRLLKEAEQSLSLTVAAVKEAQVRATMSVLADMEVARAELAVFKATVDDIHKSRVTASEAHALSAASLLFADVLATSRPLRQELAALKQLTQADELVSLALASVPAQAVTDGAPTREELLAHFAVVRGEVRKAALAPTAAPAMVGQVVGGLLAAVSWVPSGYVSGDGVEEVLSRVAFLVNFGDLPGALREMEGIQGAPRELAKDWEKSVRCRLASEQALKVLKASAALRHITLAK